MATFNYQDNNYNGEFLEDLLTYTAQGNETYKEGLIHIKSGIQHKYTLPLVTLGRIVQDHVATPAAATGNNLSTNSIGQYDFSERFLEPQDFMIYFEFNPRDFEEYYKPFQPHGNLVFRELDPKIQATMVRLLMQNKDEYIDSAIWCSQKGGNDESKVRTPTGSGYVKIGDDHAYGPQKYFDGAINRILRNAGGFDGARDANKVQITGSTALTTGAQVEQALYATWKAMPTKLRKKQGMVILMDQESWDLYDQELTSRTVKYTDNTTENSLKFRGKKIIPMSSLPKDTIIFGEFNTTMNSNLWMGVDYANDENVLQIDKLQNNSELYFFKMILKMDVNIVRPGEIFIWTSYTALA